MKNLMTLVALSLACLCSPVFAADSCEAKAADKKLAGAAKDSFVKKCSADAAAAGPKSCDAKAADKKLAGAAKDSYLKKCETDSKASMASSACDMQAKEKKLAGAAKNSFVKKCVTDAGT